MLSSIKTHACKFWNTVSWIHPSWSLFSQNFKNSESASIWNTSLSKILVSRLRILHIFDFQTNRVTHIFTLITTVLTNRLCNQFCLDRDKLAIMEIIFSEITALPFFKGIKLLIAVFCAYKPDFYVWKYSLRDSKPFQLKVLERKIVKILLLLRFCKNIVENLLEQ